LRLSRRMARISRHESGDSPARDVTRSRARWAAEELLKGLEACPAPPADAHDIALVRSLDTLLAQTMRATRHTSGSVRAYASLIEDGYASGSNAVVWAARIGRAAGELDEFSARLGALRLCENERVVDMNWGDVFARVAARCGTVGACTIEVIDRTAGPFRQRAELVARVLFHVLRNAVEATPRGGIVRMRADQIKIENRPAVHVRITDMGTGIDAGLPLDSIWKPFVTTRAGHAGLGLAYVAACASVVGMVNGVRSNSSGTTIHTVIFEEGELSW
jgi:signal transduction histidine kinase